MKDADLVIVGAGAAGLMASIAAGRAAQGRLTIELLDSRAKIGAKILVSGGTRCNVTNRAVADSDYHGGRPHFVRHVLEAFSPARTISFFSELGVPLVLEPTGKYFPQTHSGRTVLDALVKESARAGARLVFDARVTRLRPAAGIFEVETGSGGGWRARRVILATGGLSLPETGSDGTGLRIAEALGHAIVPTAPALTPFNGADAGWSALAGVTLPVKLSFFLEGKKRAETHDSFLFTHTGFSGPAVLDLSRHWTAAEGRARRVEASFLPAEDDASLRARLAGDRSGQPVKYFLSDHFPLPARLIVTLLQKALVPEQTAMARLTAENRESLVRTILHADLGVTGVAGYKKAEVTAGGVDLSEVRQAAMESRRVPGLHFCGEILDVDGRIGGFNFQWAWSSGWIAGSAAAKALL